MYNILVTVDSNYIPPLKVMLYSLFSNNPGKRFNIILIYSNIEPGELDGLRQYISSFGQEFCPVLTENRIFAGAPITKYYSQAMYYRLLAHLILPEDITKALYLDPDILVINSIESLYATDISGWLFGACSHSSNIISGINKVRLQNPDSESYYNSGVLLMNLERQRLEMKADDIFAYIIENEMLLILPDQDVLNGLYGSRILSLDDSVYNFDVRKNSTYNLASGGIKNIDWVIENTVFLHFCGKRKPWQPNYLNKYGLLYKHYQHLSGVEFALRNLRLS